MKKSVKLLVKKNDDAKKVNPLDLSSDQDLTIALMNLVAIEDMAPDSQVAQMVRDMRRQLMAPMVENIKTDEKLCDLARQLLGRAAEQMRQAESAQNLGDNDVANGLYNDAYESYVMYLATVYGINV